MRQNELMIGDWVRVVTEETDSPMKVTAIEHSIWACEVGCMSDEYCCDDIRPLPITEEILKANELLSSKPKTVGFNTATGDYLELTYRSGMLHWTVESDEYDVLDLRFVHELQHTLRLYGLHWIADNFKIE